MFYYSGYSYVSDRRTPQINDYMKIFCKFHEIVQWNGWKYLLHEYTLAKLHFLAETPKSYEKSIAQRKTFLENYTFQKKLKLGQSGGIFKNKLLHIKIFKLNTLLQDRVVLELIFKK